MSLPASAARLLIADDDVGVRGVLEEFLCADYDCEAVGSAEEALALLGAGRFQLVISDIAMEGMTGLEMIPRVRAQSPDTLVIMVSGSQTVESAVEAMRAGAFDYITKPFDLDHVARAVRRALEFGSLLHDIGKIGVPDAVLRKPARLTDEEWSEMRRHPLHGQQILSGIEFLEGASRVVAQHHERFDGTGYPLGLRGEQIDLNARIFSVADAFDAITSDRVYRKAKPYGAAIAELEEWAGRQSDPEVVEAFRRVPASEWDELRSHSWIKNAGEVV